VQSDGPGSLDFFPNTNEAFIITDSVGILDRDGSCIPVSNFVACPASEGTRLTVDAGDGDDSVVVYDTVVHPVFICGGAGNDALIGGPGGDRIGGGQGSDYILGDGGASPGTGGADIIGGNAVGELHVCAGDGVDSSTGDRIDGGVGTDWLIGSSGPDTIDGGPGDDTLYGHPGNDSLDGGTENDNLVAGDGDDSLHGREGTDELTGGRGSDSEFGGDGNDQLGTTWTLTPGNVERDDGDDSMDGGSGDDVLNGGPGALMVTGFFTSLKNIQEGDEVADPNGSDQMSGGDGRDTVTYVKRATAVVMSHDGEANDGAPGERDRIGLDVESLVGGSGDDTIIGGSSSDELDGGKGADTIEGQAGDDHLNGGRGDEGRDRLGGGDGNDTMSGMNGGDTLAGGAGTDTLAGGGGADLLDGAGQDDTLTGGPGSDLVLGGTGNDDIDGADPTLQGADGVYELRGQQGSDFLKGGGGDDVLAGGPESDVLRGGAGIDAADYSAAVGQVTIKFDGKANDGEQGEQDNLGADVEAARGGGEKDFLSGDSRANVLNGGVDEDFIEGGSGTDRLNGNDGNDAIRSRDSERDIVSCGRGFDMAVADDLDLVRDNCELVDRDAGRQAAVGRMVSLRRVAGLTELRPRSMDRSFPIRGEMSTPVRSSVDAREGTVELSTGTPGKRLRTSRLRGAAFTVDQRRSRSPLTEVRLRGGKLDGCGRPGRSGAAKNQARRSLRVRTDGRLRVAGRQGEALGRNASWTTTDSCNGTLIRVRRGEVEVVDRSSGKTLTLEAGESHLAQH
jgi:Ca2+-binding RTX toxin-like protein